MYKVADMIEEIKKRPSLWDSTCKQNTDRICRSTLWQEIGQALFENWNTFNKTQKNDRLSEIKKKWRNIRDYYRKESKRWKGKNYMYKDVLKFLDKPATVKHTKASLEIKKEPSPEKEMSFEALDEATMVEMPTVQVENLLNISELNGSFSDTDLSSVRRKPEEDDDIDEDKSFLLSLLPEMRRLSGRQKMDFKISVLSDLRTARYSQQCSLIRGNIGDQF